MNRYLVIYSGCEISRDPAQNTANHQAMVDELNALITADGWEGAKVVAFSSNGRFTSVGIEPGPAPLTLEYLRRMKEAAKEERSEPARPVLVAEQGRLL